MICWLLFYTVINKSGKKVREMHVIKEKTYSPQSRTHGDLVEGGDDHIRGRIADDDLHGNAVDCISQDGLVLDGGALLDAAKKIRTGD